MAITANKLLGKNGKGGPLAVRPKSNLVPFKGKGSDITKIEKKEESPLLVIKTKVIKIEDILKGTLAAEKRAADEKRKVQEQEERSENEEELENPDKKGKKSGIKIPLPGKVKGWWNNIKKFFFTVLFGWLALRVMKWLPRLKGILKFLASFADFVLKWGGRILAGLVTFVDWGYKAYDWTRDKIEGVFGEKGVQAFDSISGVLNKSLNLIFGLGLAMIALSGEWGNQGGDRNRFGVDDAKIKNRRVRINNPEYLDKLKNRFKRRFGKNIPANRIPDPVQVDQPRKPNFLDKAKSKFKKVKVTNPLEDFMKRVRANQAKGLDIWGNKMKPNIGTQISNLWESGSGWRQKRLTQVAEGGEWLQKGTVSNVRKVSNVVSGQWSKFSGAISDGWSRSLRSIDTFVNEGLEKLSPRGVINWLAEQDGLLGKLGRKIPGFFSNPLMKKMLGGIPLAGDLIGFLIDMSNGMDWRRAFIVAAMSAWIDSMVVSLPFVSALLAPFTGGASLVAGAALLGLYMAADEMTGRTISHASGYRHKTSFTRILGHLLSDYLGIPDSRNNEAPKEVSPGSVGSGANAKKAIDDMNKLIAMDPDKSKVMERLGGNTIKGDLSTISFGGKTYPRGMPGLGAYIPGDGKGGSTYNKIVSTISVNGEGPGEVIVVKKSSSKSNNNENVTGGKVIAVDTGSGAKGISDAAASLYRGD